MHRLLVRSAGKIDEIGPRLADIGQRAFGKLREVGRFGLQREQALVRVEPRRAIGEVTVDLDPPPCGIDVVLGRKLVGLPAPSIVSGCSSRTSPVALTCVDPPSRCISPAVTTHESSRSVTSASRWNTAPTNPEFPEAIGETDGILSPTGYTPDADYPSNAEFVDFYTEQHGNPPNEDEANAWTTMQVVAAAAEANDCADPSPECQQSMIDWLRENEVETVVGPLSWDAEGRPQAAHLIQQWQDDEIVIVLPEDASDAELSFPKQDW